MAEVLKLDYKKIEDYSKMFDAMKRELFPKQEYRFRNEACSAFAHLLSEKARKIGAEPMKIWCYKSDISEELFQEMKQNSPSTLKAVASKEQLSSLIVSRIPGDNVAGVDYLMWQEHHVAMCLELPIYQNSAKRERIVFDPVLFDAPVREKDWMNALNTNQAYTQITPSEPDTRANQLNLRSKKMINKIILDKPVQLLKSPLTVLANVEKRKNVSRPVQMYSALEM